MGLEIWAEDFEAADRALRNLDLTATRNLIAETVATERERQENYYKAVHIRFIQYLASQYRNGMAREIAGLCDETLDRSGRLLGEVRKAAAKQ